MRAANGLQQSATTYICHRRPKVGTDCSRSSAAVQCQLLGRAVTRVTPNSGPLRRNSRGDSRRRQCRSDLSRLQSATGLPSDAASYLPSTDTVRSREGVGIHAFGSSPCVFRWLLTPSEQAALLLDTSVRIDALGGPALTRLFAPSKKACFFDNSCLGIDALRGCHALSDSLLLDLL